MKRILYYISEYGYGHASRSIGIIRELLKEDSQVEILVTNHYAKTFLEQSLKSDRVYFRDVTTDIGYFLKGNTIQPDQVKQTEELERFLSSLEEQVEKEVQMLQGYNIDLILSDISPLAFEVADRLGIPSIGISNFTWHTAYKELVSEDLLGKLSLSYEKADYFFELAGSQEGEWGESSTYDFLSREIDEEEVFRIIQTYGKHKNLVFFGLGMKLDLPLLNDLSIWNNPNIHFIISSNAAIQHPNVTRIPGDYTETQNYIAACDLVITKAGWGTISEAAISGTQLLIVERENMAEDANTIQMVREYDLGKIMKWEEFISLPKIDLFDLESEPQRNDSQLIAKRIIALLHAGGRII
ncbi:glycosyltransferase family protein [Metabacillus idriensis]|uniref:glycosyltransferase family protein n=1 Tax=Metabacillus idriensis TaxID=324768 RepID=UPI001748C51F|nr:glycosyltransferase family protein [Metabacillus idriensis]